MIITVGIGYGDSSSDLGVGKIMNPIILPPAMGE